MLNRLGLTATIAVLIASSSTPALSVPKPGATRSSAIDLLCYAKLSSGQIVNLAMLCRQPSNLSGGNASREVESAISSGTQLAITETRYAAGRLSGQVTNNTDKPVKNIKVNYEILDSEGNVIDGGFVRAGTGTIAPGGSAMFSGAAIAGGSKVRVTFAEWSD